MLLASILAYSFLFAPATPQDGEGFFAQARALQGKEAWQELVELAEREIETGEDDTLALTFLAIAQAGLKEFSASAGSLKRLKDGGADPDQAIEGFAPPMAEVVNTIYAHCWANFDAEFNRQCWAPMFEAFPDSRYTSVAASRLLMAALKSDETKEVRRIEDYFQQELEEARQAEESDRETTLSRRFVDGYLRANRSNAEVMQLATEVWSRSWAAAQAEHGFDGSPTGGDWTSEQWLARQKCELDTDHAFNSLARATSLADLTLESGHPLFEMEAEPAVRFIDCTEEVGLGDIRASRVAAADFDRDGDPDLCLAGRLFENRKGMFVEVSKERGVTRRGAGAVFGDYDADGYLDLLVAGGRKPFLLRNLGKRGKFRFEDVSEDAGLTELEFAATPEGVAWVDFDDDGDLDLYFALYEKPMAQGHADVLLENRGKGVFEQVAAAKGIDGVGPFCGRGVSPCDLDADGDTEIFVSNYRLSENLCWEWDAEQERLVERSQALGIKGVRQPADGQYFGHTIGSCWGDVDGDGDFDLFSANLAHPRFVKQGFSNLSMLGIQQDDGRFADETLQRGIRFQETHSDPALVDIDNDGDLDLSITCIYEGVPSALYQNDGSGRFMPITFRAGAAAFHAWGQAWLDFDGDGFLDVVYASSNGVRVLRNSGNDNHYVRVALVAKRRDPSAFGAIVRVTEMEAESPRSWVRQLFNARGTTSQDEPILHFGLGAYEGRVKVEVTWPESNRTESKTPRPDRVYSFKQVR